MRHKRPSAGLIGAGLLWLFIAASMNDGLLPLPAIGVVVAIGVAHFAVYGYQHLLWIGQREDIE